MCFAGFNSVPNLIVILFNLLYPVFIVGFNRKSCVWERVCVWRLKQLKTEEFLWISHEMMHVPCTWLEYEELAQMETVVFHK